LFVEYEGLAFVVLVVVVRVGDGDAFELEAERGFVDGDVDGLDPFLVLPAPLPLLPPPVLGVDTGGLLLAALLLDDAFLDVGEEEEEEEPFFADAGGEDELPRVLVFFGAEVALVVEESLCLLDEDDEDDSTSSVPALLLLVFSSFEEEEDVDFFAPPRFDVEEEEEGGVAFPARLSIIFINCSSVMSFPPDRLPERPESMSSVSSSYPLSIIFFLIRSCRFLFSCIWAINFSTSKSDA